MSRKDIRIWRFSCDQSGCYEFIDITLGDHFIIGDKLPTQVMNASDAEYVMRRYFGWARPTKWRWECLRHQAQQQQVAS